MTKIYNEKGITLVELLAALALLGLISVLIWNLFFQSLNFNDRAVTKNQLQQEANLIVNTIQQTHTKNKIKSIKEKDSKIYIIFINDKGQDIPIDFKNQNIRYDLENEIINPGNTFSFVITLTSANSKIEVTTKTIFSKLEGKNQ